MAGNTPRPVVKEVHINAPPEVVFEFFVDAEKLTRWLAIEATLDPRPGGACLQVHAGDDRRECGPCHMRGEFLEVDPPNRVVFTWGFTEPEIGVPPGSSTVEVTLRPVGSGTLVRLVHRDLPPAEVEDHTRGWAEMLDRLAYTITTRTDIDRGREASVGTVHHEVWINAERSTVFQAITSRSGLDAWWGKAVNAEPKAGYVVEFDHGLGDMLRMRITDLVANERLAWKCVSDYSDHKNPASEWLGHRLFFDLEDGGPTGFAPIDSNLAGDHVTILHFRHAGWSSESRWYAFCNYAWGVALAGLASYCEGKS